MRTNKLLVRTSGIATRYLRKFENLESFIFQAPQSMVNQRDLAKRNEDSPMLLQNLAWGLSGGRGGGGGLGVGGGKQGVLWEMRK